MSNRFQQLLAEMAAGIPPAYLAAVAEAESAFNPQATNGHAAGLFQITPPVLKDYNDHHGTAYTRTDLLDPLLNTRIAVEHIHAILDLYSTIPALRPDWSDRRWIELLTLGWNAGHVGVARVVRAMQRADVPTDRTTADTVHTAALALPNPGYLADPKHVRFAKAITASFFGDKKPRPQIGGRGASTAVALLAPLGALALGNSVFHASGRSTRRRRPS
jgi:hypothetical protein